MNQRLYLIAALFLVIFAAFYMAINQEATENFNDGEISFDYPQDWQMKPGFNPSVIAAFYDTNSGLNVTVNKQVIPPGYQYPENFIFNTTEAFNSGFRLLSHRIYDLNGDTAYDNTYYINSNGSIYLREEIWLHKNGNLYSIIYTHKESSYNTLPVDLNRDIINIPPEEDLTENSTNQLNIKYFDLKSSMEDSITRSGFEVLIKNFKVDSVSIPTKTSFMGDVSIPAINVTWGIRPDTVNGYNSVYHYNESYYPGQYGSMGLLGHRSLYSAPFAKIDQLKPGDLVIIDDYLTQKKYIYKVVSNGDIKWDYKTDPIKFPGGNTDLILVTCYPPGTTDAAWIVHCKLSSIEPL